MYHYQVADQQLVEGRAHQFKNQVARRITGALNEEEFRPLRLMNGLYLEMHAYMLRIAIPYGGLSANQLHVLAEIAEKYDRGYGHFTTRQNIQFNWLELTQVPEVLQLLSTVDMHAIQSSGNCIRSVTSDPYAAAAPDELMDPRPTAELIRQWSSLHPEFAFLGRKFKIAVTGSDNDRAAIRVHDIGIQLVENKNSEPGYKLFIGGGLGRTPMVSELLCEFLPQDDLLAYLEATLRVFNRYGRRDNKYKARIKILTRELGINSLRKQIELEFDKSINHSPITSNRLRNIEQQFVVPVFECLSDLSLTIDALKASDPIFNSWFENNIKSHKVPGYSIVNISLKPIAGIPGDLTAIQMHAIADLAERFSFSEIRVTKDQNIVLPHVKLDNLNALWQELRNHNLAEANAGLITDIVSCPGMDYCSLATARSIPIAQQISERFADPQLQKSIGPVSLKISGCINACGHHHIGQIGILGLEKNAEEYYQLVLGGNSNQDATIGRVTGPGFSKDEVVEAVEKVIDTYLQQKNEDETFAETYQRTGSAPFKEVLYETD